MLTASAIKNTGIDDIYEMIESYILLVKNNDFFEKNRNEQNTFWLKSTIQQHLFDSFFKNKKISKILNEEIEALKKGETTPFSSAKKILNFYSQQSIRNN